MYIKRENKLQKGISTEADRMTYVIYDYIPTGPNPQKSTKVELQPDRNYQFWALRKLQSIDHDIEVLGHGIHTYQMAWNVTREPTTEVIIQN